MAQIQPVKSLRSGFPWYAIYHPAGEEQILVKIQSFTNGSYTFSTTEGRSGVAKATEIKEAVSYFIETDPRFQESYTWQPVGLTYPFAKLNKSTKPYSCQNKWEVGGQENTPLAKDTFVRIGESIADSKSQNSGSQFTPDSKEHVLPIIESKTLEFIQFILASDLDIHKDAPPLVNYKISLLCYEMVLVAARKSGVLSNVDYWSIVKGMIEGEDRTKFGPDTMGYCFKGLELDYKKRCTVTLEKPGEMRSAEQMWVEGRKTAQVEVGDLCALTYKGEFNVQHVALVCDIEPVTREVQTWSLWGGARNVDIIEKISITEYIPALRGKSEVISVVFSKPKWDG